MHKTKPLVSIIIATYNRSNILKYTISTVLKQNYQHFEILVIGDHCTDDTESVINSFDDKRISFYNLEENFGEQSYPNNFGFQKSKGELIAWLNHDDLWYPEHLDTLIKTLYNTESDVVYSWLLPYKAKVINLPIFKIDPKYSTILSIPASSWLVKRSTVIEVGLWKSARQIYNAPSQEWISRTYKLGKKITPVNKLTVIAIQSGSRKNSYSDRQEQEHQYVYNKMYDTDFREEMLTEICHHLAYRFNEISLKKNIIYILKKPILFLAIRYQISPFGFINRIKYMKKGGHINSLRQIRGLSKLK